MDNRTDKTTENMVDSMTDSNADNLDENVSLAGYDPFDEPLETVFDEDEELILDDIYFEAARNSVTYDGMVYSFMKPPYMNFKDQSDAKKKMLEAYNQKEFLILFGYSGCGKTTLQNQLASRYPHFIKMVEDFDDLAPAEMNIKIGELTKLELLHRSSQVGKLKDHLARNRKYMLIFDNVSLSKTASAITKLNTLCKLNETTRLPIIISGVTKLYNDLYSDKNLPSTCSIVSRMDEYELHGMNRQDAGNYLAMVSKIEHVRFTYSAQQALVATALNKLVGGINAMVTVLGRCITMARAQYYNSDGRTIPDKAKCIRPAVPNGKEYPGAELILTLPVTPEHVLIDEYLVSRMQNEYKAHFPTLEKTDDEATTDKHGKKR